MIRRWILHMRNRRGSAGIAWTAALIASLIGAAAMLTLAFPASGSARMSPPSPIHAICLVMLGGSVMAMIYGWYTLASMCAAGTLALLFTATMTLAMGTGNIRLLSGSVDLHSLPTAVSLAALACGAAGCLFFLIGNGPLRPVRRSCGLLVSISGILGMFDASPLSSIIPGAGGSMSIITSVALISIGLAIYEVERNDR